MTIKAQLTAKEEMPAWQAYLKNHVLLSDNKPNQQFNFHNSISIQ